MLCICVVCGRVREKSITQTIRRLETFCSIHDHIYGHRALLFWALILLSTSIFLPKGYDFNMTRPDSSNPINHQIVTQGSPRYACTYGASPRADQHMGGMILLTPSILVSRLSPMIYQIRCFPIFVHGRIHSVPRSYLASTGCPTSPWIAHYRGSFCF